MLKLIGIAVLASASGVAVAQTSDRPERWATSVCDLMTPEEMRVCLATKPGDTTGARGPRCDEIAQHQIEMCLQQGEKSGQASSGATRETSRESKEGKIPAPSPQKKE